MTTPVGRQEQLVRAAPDIFKIASGASFAGKVTISSGVAAVDVVYPGLSSADLFTSLVPVLSSISAISSRVSCLGITSMVPGTGFTIGWATGIALPLDIVVHWTTVRTA